MRNIYWIDLFCGAGGTSTGIHLAGQKVIACVNHDAKAIKSHKANHPNAIHFTEDIRDFHVVDKLKALVRYTRKQDPTAIIALWASLECTNFSNAKGGKPRDADSRTLADHMYMYLKALSPEYFWVENVKEFMAWGPLDKSGKPISRSKGRDYIKWIKKIESFDYRHDFQIMNAANYGAVQSRERLFIQFAKPNYPMSWPEQTHAKKVDGALFSMKKWRAVREVLDLEDQGKSIFDRKKPLCDNTLKRIYAGLQKFVKSSDRAESFLAKYFSGREAGKCISVEQPSGAIKTVDSHSLININYLQTYYGNGGVHGIETVSPTLRTKDCVAKIDVVFVDQQYGESKPASIDVPIGALTGNPKFALVNPNFIMSNYSGGGQHTDINNPSGAITSVPKQNLVSVHPWVMDTNFNNIGKSVDEPSSTLMASRNYPYLVNANSSTSPPVSVNDPAPTITQRTHLIINPSWFGTVGSVNDPSCTVIARQDKSPLYLLAAEQGPIAWIVFKEDSEMMIKIKHFMVENGITDIKMRMLKVPELLQIQGFPKDYQLKGTQTQQKKQIGNAVEVNQSLAIARAFNNGIKNHFAA
ncbi:MAG TPA: DNA cytosine methyltransferase [Saprospiraceae bacterium]|nr:DNA cytosine methyltransferase [Saprospiraceae bacterium]